MKNELGLRSNLSSAKIKIKNEDRRCPYCGKEADEKHIRKCEKRSPLVSVVIPSRVGEEIISTETLKTQTYKNLEIIIEYDEKQEGASATRNRGAAKAKGGYLFFCDNDLVLRPTCISDLYLALRSDPEAKWSFGKFYIDGNLFNENKDPFPPERKGTIEWMYYFHGMSTMSLIDASVKPHFDEKMKRFNDWDLWLILNEKGYRGVFCDKVLFTTENRRTGISKISSEDIKKWKMKLIEKHQIDVVGGIEELYGVIAQKNEELQKKADRCKYEIDEAVVPLKEELKRKEREILEIKSSLHWLIPNYFYKRYKKYIKPYIPRFAYTIFKPFFMFLNNLRNSNSEKEPLFGPRITFYVGKTKGFFQKWYGLSRMGFEELRFNGWEGLLFAYRRHMKKKRGEIPVDYARVDDYMPGLVSIGFDKTVH